MRRSTVTEATCARCWDHNRVEDNPDANGWAQITCQEAGKPNIVTEDDTVGDLCPDCLASFVKWFNDQARG